MAYITTRDLKDIYPSIDEFDTKTPLYGFVQHSGSRYRADDVGLVTQLFANGKNLGAGQSSISDVDANDEWYYDDANDVIITLTVPPIPTICSLNLVTIGMQSEVAIYPTLKNTLILG